MLRNRPSLLVSTLVVLFFTALWGYLRLFLVSESILPLSFILPLLLCIWTGRYWQIWTMAAVFVLMATVKVWGIIPDDAYSTHQRAVYFGSTLFNILVGATVIHAILKLRDRLEIRNSTISAQNAELEAQAEELAAQNEEIRAQSEELAEQNEEIEAQSEEVARQNEELLDLNHRLSGREEILHGLLQSSRRNDSTASTLDALCKRALLVIGAPASHVAVLRKSGDSLALQSQARVDKTPLLPDCWPFSGSIAEVVYRERKTAYVSDLRQRRDLAQPFDTSQDIHSILATPLQLNNGHTGLLVACSTESAHWTEEQFHVIEWIAAQCEMMLEMLHHQQAQAEHAEALEEANRSKDRFLAMLSHELRTPLTPVLAAAGVLEKDARLPEDIREDLGMIRRNAGIQSRLIDDLLDLTRINRNKLELNRQTLHCGTLLRDAIRIVSGDIDAKSQRLHLQVEALDQYAIIGDGPRLQQVFWNLLKNANKFSPQGATITLKGNARGDMIAIEVQDHGIGINPTDAERIFLPFEQILHEPRRSSDGGLGLGLAIAKAVVEMHGGSLFVRSGGPGRGATFVVELPAIPHSSATLPASENAEDFSPNQVQHRLLLIEDHHDTALIMKRFLQTSGYEVTHAVNAASAFQLVQDRPFDLIVSDIGLPDESGLSLLQRIRSVRPEARAICLSGYGMEQDVTACHEAGFLEHLTKPVDTTQLLAAIAKCLTDR